jgi:MtN3 and saliva related transmembrane protein
MDNSTAIGMVAGALTTLAYLPQVVKTWKSKSTKDISVSTFVSLFLGLLMWVFYGVSIHSMPVIVANIVSLALVLVVLIFKIRYG